ncbi:hypothetical protein EJ104_02130 [Deinococcus radiophilus]|uniref:DUF3108 domain-containing protein n=1 Tax=Deinococcus radiophilus TaxID=32062 RepID=A0A431W4K8_9DEIO|nr:hypothetical protein EJ104_02130 [Deinococcus radiophilus]
MPHWAQAGEEFELALSLGGKYAGTQRWSIHPERGAVVTRVDTEFGGVLPHLRMQQTSRLHPRTLAQLGYTEGEGGRTGYDLSLDYRSGLVRLRQRGEEAELPLLQDHLDPVSVLLWVREWQVPVGTQRIVRLAGNGIHVQRLPDGPVTDSPEAADSQVFVLRPGGAGVWRSATQPHTFLRLTQPTPFGMIDALPGGSWSERPGVRGDSAKPRERRRVG